MHTPKEVTSWFGTKPSLMQRASCSADTGHVSALLRPLVTMALSPSTGASNDGPESACLALDALYADLFSFSSTACQEDESGGCSDTAHD